MNKTGKFTLIPALLLVVAFLFGCATGTKETADQETTDWMFPDRVDIAFVEQHVTVPMPENVMLIDARPKEAKYDKGHIPMAVNIPWTQFDKNVDLLPEDKSALLIYYCEGLTCKLSHKSAFKARSLGYTNVKVFAEGFPAWIAAKGNYASVSADWMKKQVDSGADMVVVDARPKQAKYDKGHIPGAVSMPTSSFDKMVDVLPTDKNRLLVFYCGGFKCKLSHQSAAKAIALGYTNVKVFAAGYPAWQVVAGGAAMAAAPKAGAEEGSIDIETFKTIVTEKPDSIYLVDVRDPDEFAAGSFKTAVNIPVDQLEGRIATLPTDRPVVFICGTGARSGESYYMLRDLKPEMKNVFYLDAELEIKKDGTFTITKPSA